MKTSPARLIVLAALVGLLFGYASTTEAADAEKASTFTIGEGSFKLPIPEGWDVKQPRVRIIEHEFQVPPANGDEQAGRVTVMGAAGTIDANIDRWCGQFSQPDGSDTKDKVKTKKLTIAGQDVQIVDLSGTYDDKAGPFVPGPGVQRPNYRMLAAIISTKKAGNYFVKFYGPNQTVSGQETNFMKMIEGLQAN
jgi:hypothetical protein